jgi:hypothetical protein
LFYLFSSLYGVAALIIVEILLELLEIVLTTIRPEEPTRGDAKRDHRFISFGIFSVSSLSLALRISWQCVCTRPVHPYRKYPFCAFISWLPISPLHALSIASISRLPIYARSVHPFREYPILDFQSICRASSFPFVVKLTLA